MEKQFKVIVGEGRALTVRREMLAGGAWEISAVRSDGEKMVVSSSIQPTTVEALNKMIDIAGDFIRTESR